MDSEWKGEHHRNRDPISGETGAHPVGVGVGTADVFVNVVGGVRIEDPGADLAVALAVASAVRGVSLTGREGRPLACFGELGLTGELRTVAHADRRVAEAQKFGLDPIVAPEEFGKLRAALGAALGRRAPAAAAA